MLLRDLGGVPMLRAAVEAVPRPLTPLSLGPAAEILVAEAARGSAADGRAEAVAALVGVHPRSPAAVELLLPRGVEFPPPACRGVAKDSEPRGVPSVAPRGVEGPGTRFARVAYRRDANVSSAFVLAGEQLTNISVFAVFPKESCRTCVNLWFLYGTALCPWVKDSMTSPSAVSDLLMSIASFCLSPTASDFLSLSEPAKSIS